MGNTNGAGCNICVRKGIKCEYSVKKKPGPKSRKREDEEGFEEHASSASTGQLPGPHAARSPSPSLGITKTGGGVTAIPSVAMPQVSFVPGSGSQGRGVGRVGGSFEAKGETEYHAGRSSTDGSGRSGVIIGGGGGGGATPLGSSPSSRHLLTPSKKARPSHTAAVTPPMAGRQISDDDGVQLRMRMLGQQQNQQHQLQQLPQPLADVATRWRWGGVDGDADQHAHALDGVQRVRFREKIEQEMCRMCCSSVTVDPPICIYPSRFFPSCLSVLHPLCKMTYKHKRLGASLNPQLLK